MDRPKPDVTTLLRCWADGDARALDRLIPTVYRHLRARAGRLFQQENPSHTLQPTALVHETWMRLVDQQHPDFRNREHFFALSAQLMRRILIDHARGRKAGKRGGSVADLSLEHARHVASAPRQFDQAALAEALDRLAELDPRQASIAACRFFVGLSVEETAGLLDISTPTVKRECRSARAWLHAQLGRP